MKKIPFIVLLLCAVSFAQTNVARMLSGVNAQTGTSYTFVASDVTKVVTFNNLGSVSATLLAGSTTGFGAGSVFTAVNLGAGTVTIVCSGCTINGSASIQVAQNQSVSLYGDGANYVSASGSSTGSANFASPPPLGNTTPNSVAGTVVNIAGSGLFFSAQPTCLFGESDNTLDEFEDVGGIPMWLPQGALGPCSQFLTYTPLPVGVSPTDKQVLAWNAATGAFTIQTQSGSGNPAFSALTSATNSTATMTVGTGASMNTSGTGSIQATGLPRSAVASLPSTLPTGTIYEVTDGSFQGDCSLGGGSFPALCAWNGSIWQPTGDGGGVTSNPGTINLAISYKMSCATINGTGASTTTNGLVNSGSTSILLTSATGFTPGQGVFIDGAGAAGGPYNAIVLTVVSNTITVNVATATSVTNAKVLNYAAAVQTTTNGTVGTGTSVPVANAATFFAGEGIFIAGAGAAAADYVGTVQSVSGNTLTVSPATSTSVTNALVLHDESAALNSAFTDLANGTTNGMLMPPAGICNFNGPLLRTGDANAIVPLPNVPYFSGLAGTVNGPTLSITIAGATTPAWTNYNMTGWTSMPSWSGTVFQTTRTSGNFIAANNPNEGDKFTAVHLTIRDLTFRTIDNPGITMVDVRFAIGLSAERLLFDTLANGAQSFPSQPTHSNGQALLTPTLNNDGQNYIRDIRINGYFLGMTWGEHLNADHVALYANWQGMACNMGNTNFHRSVAQYMDVTNNAYGIVANGAVACWLDIQALDTELNQVPSWVSAAPNQAQIYDPGNFLNGIVRVIYKNFFNTYGAKNLQVLYQDTSQITGLAQAFVPGQVGFAGLNTQPNKNVNAVCDRQTLEITLPTAPTTHWGSGCVSTGGTFNFTGQTVTARVPHVLTNDTHLFTVLAVGNDYQNQVAVYLNNGIFGFQKEVAGAQTILATATYNPSVMLWWRLAEASGAITASYSPDGINWTTLATCAATCVSWSYTSTWVGVEAVNENGTGPTNPGYAQFDNLSLTTTAPGYARQIVTDGLFGSSAFKEASACESSFGTTTLATGATTTDTGLNCLPINAVIDSVVYRITTTITTAANFTIGDPTTAARFCGTQSTLTSGTTGICFVQADQTGAAGPRQTAAAKVRVTANVNPGAGAIRLIVYYHTWTAPTS